MSLNKEQKAKIVEKFALHEGDTGSPEVQIALLCASILNLQQHLQKNHHDVDSKRSLLRKVAKRRSLMKYLKSTNLETYQKVAETYKLKA